MYLSAQKRVISAASAGGKSVGVLGKFLIRERRFVGERFADIWSRRIQWRGREG